jgi:type III restriction enzyme
MSAISDIFPLAAALERLTAQPIAALAAGEPTTLLEQVTPATGELLRYWFERDYCDSRELNFHDGQRQAILSVIYAHEVLGSRRLQDLYEEIAPDALLAEGALAEVTRATYQHPMYAAKMATGTGKTWVLNALMLWQYLNRAEAPTDERFSANFLLVAPGLIVYDRLLDSFLGKERQGERHFETSDLFSNCELFLPEGYRDSVFGFVQGSVVTKSDIGRKVTGGGMIALTNWHLLAGEEDPDFLPEVDAPAAESNPTDAVESIFPITPGVTSGNTLAALDRAFLRGGPLQSLKDLSDLVVFNDEAHHIHEIKRGEEVTEVEWQKSLTEIASTKAHRFIQVDFSATPYNETGGAKRGRRKIYFPHIVVDFDLNDAMSGGLVKALALDKRREVASLPLDFRAERDDDGHVIGLSSGQRTMLRAGLKKLEILEQNFTKTDSSKYPKMMVVCEDTSVTPYVVDFLASVGLGDGEILAIDSNRKGEMTEAEWDARRERLFDVDRHSRPKVIVSVLMLREGFDVDNICVIVPLRSSQAQILLEQTIGRGLRLMWRGDDEIDELKRETRERIRQKLEPTNLFDVLFVVEHPAFSQFYDELLEGGLAVEVDERADKTRVTGDLEIVGLRDEFERFDFEIPVLVRDAEEELREPSIDPLKLPTSKYPLELLKRTIGKGDRFVSEDAQTKTQYGDYRVDGGVMTATGYNDYLARMTSRITEALGSSITKSAKQYTAVSQFPMLQAYRPLLASWLDVYIRQRLFGEVMDPLEDENWRVLLVDDVAHGIAGTFATALVEATGNQEVRAADVMYRRLSEVAAINVRSSSAVGVQKCIYPKLPIPRSGGLERQFIEWADADTQIEAFAKIHEYRHDFLHRPYLKADGMPARYSPDFLVRTAARVRRAYGSVVNARWRAASGACS